MVILGLGVIQRILWGWQCAAGRLGRRSEKYGQELGCGGVVLLSMMGGYSIFRVYAAVFGQSVRAGDWWQMAWAWVWKLVLHHYANPNR
jgi:hypothetical protein